MKSTQKFSQELGTGGRILFKNAKHEHAALRDCEVHFGKFHCYHEAIEIMLDVLGAICSADVKFVSNLKCFNNRNSVWKLERLKFREIN